MDFYTEVQDLSHLENTLSSATPRFAALNLAICGLIEDFALVGFETLAVEVRAALFEQEKHCVELIVPMMWQDKHSMLHLTRAIDRATGYIYVPPASTPAPQGTVVDPDAPSAQRPNSYALFSSAAGPMLGARSDVRDVQERWVDAREEWDAYEKTQWRKEGELVRKEVEAAAKKGKIRERKGSNVQR